MALVRCPECEKEISNKAEKCPNCGYPIKLINENEESQDSLSGKLTDKNDIDKTHNIINAKKKWVFIAILIVIMLFLIVVIFTSSLDSDEQYVLKRAERIESMLKNPQSMIIYNDIVYIKGYQNNDKHYVFLNYGGENGFGAMVKSTAIFIDGVYIGDTDLDEEDFNSPEEYLDFLKAELALSTYNLMGIHTTDFKDAVVISGKKIARKMKVSYADL